MSTNLKQIGFGSLKKLPSDKSHLEPRSQSMKVLEEKDRTKPKTLPPARNLTKQEVAAAVELTWLVTCVINRLDLLQNTDLFRQDVKGAASHLLKKLEGFSGKEIWGRLGGDLIDESGNGSVLIDRLVDNAYQINMRERPEREDFANKLEALLNEFNLSLIPSN